MTWVKVDDDMPWHRKFRRTGDLRALCLALDLTGMCHCAKYGTDGFVDDDDLPEVLDVLPRSRRSPVLGLLVEVKRWERGTKDGHKGYWIRNYLKYNPSRTDQEAEKKRHAEATARWRARQRGDQSRGDPGDSHVTGRDSAPGDSAPSPRGLQKPKGQASVTPPSRDPSPRGGAKRGGDTVTPSQRDGPGDATPPSGLKKPKSELLQTTPGDAVTASVTDITPAASPAGSSQAAADLAAEPQNNGQPPTAAQRAALRAALERKRQDADAEEVNQP
jgi:hypothetical protein